MMRNKVDFQELSIEEQVNKVLENYKKQIEHAVLYDVMTAFYFADWTRKCDYDNMTSEEVVEAAMSVCRKLEEKYKYSLIDEFRVNHGVECGGVDW
jgi:DNA-directed RNA polymerase subunit F